MQWTCCLSHAEDRQTTQGRMRGLILVLICSSCGASPTQGHDDQSPNVPHVQGPFNLSQTGDRKATQGRMRGLRLVLIGSSCAASSTQGHNDQSHNIPHMQGPFQSTHAGPHLNQFVAAVMPVPRGGTTSHVKYHKCRLLIHPSRGI